MAWCEFRRLTCIAGNQMHTPVRDWDLFLHRYAQSLRVKIHELRGQGDAFRLLRASPTKRTAWPKQNIRYQHGTQRLVTSNHTMHNLISPYIALCDVHLSEADDVRVD